MSVTRIPLRRRDGSVRGWTLIDESDCEWVTEFSWYMLTPGSKWPYAARHELLPEGKRRTVLLHRAILGLHAGDGYEGDHINGNTLDNRRVNLRTTLRAGNAQNRRPIVGRFRGVYFRSDRNVWVVEPRYNRRKYYLGAFRTEDEAGAVAVKFYATHAPTSPEARSSNTDGAAGVFLGGIAAGSPRREV